MDSYLVDALFDLGASHLFISYDYARCLGLAVDTLLYDLCVSTLIGARILTSIVCLNCIVQYTYCCTMLDLVCMPFCDIDIILGLNWLSSQNILLDCKNKMLILLTQELTPQAEVKLNLITAAQVDKWLRQDCQGYIIFFSVKRETKEGILDIPIVRDYPEVFPTGISGLPPEWEIEFAIDLVPGTNLILKAPY
ncbi:uncharacterized protein LOC114726079 [Neltuma alba]|uniref:uncharacterized protein LOC114726079 n=1 Tax=Neltuma alba TaxID=207710 RepID=UPI0010A2B23C|nr:uncharacterized protein LOC114726079 [Prosopis alba]